MRLYEFTLMEYSRDITIQKLGTKLTGNHENKPIEEVIEVLEEIDPTKNKQYVLWLANQYIKKQFRLEDKSRINKLLVDFNKLKPRLEQKDIGKYDLYLLDKTIDDILNPDISDDSFDVDIPDVKVLYKGPLGFLAIPETTEASCKLGSGTKWCTSASDRNNMFTHYNDQGSLYIWKDNTGKYQFHFEAKQFMDSHDVPLSPEKLKYFRSENPVTKKLFAMKEKEIAKDPADALEYASDILKDRFELGEPVISSDARKSYAYALDVLKGRFELGEQTISKDSRYAYYYARDILKGRFELGEPAIASYPEIAYRYASNILHDRFELAESGLAKYAEHAYNYAFNVLKGRFELGEPAMADDPYIAYDYAQDVLEGRFEMGEPAIASDPSLAYRYAVFIMKGRFPLGEPAINDSISYLKKYNDYLKSIQP